MQTFGCFFACHLLHWTSPKIHSHCYHHLQHQSRIRHHGRAKASSINGPITTDSSSNGITEACKQYRTKKMNRKRLCFSYTKCAWGWHKKSSLTKPSTQKAFSTTNYSTFPYKRNMDWFAGMQLKIYLAISPQKDKISVHYWGLGGLLFAADTREPHSNSSLLVSSLCNMHSKKQRQSFFGPRTIDIAFSSSSSVLT